MLISIGELSRPLRPLLEDRYLSLDICRQENDEILNNTNVRTPSLAWLGGVGGSNGTTLFQPIRVAI